MPSYSSSAPAVPPGRGARIALAAALGISWINLALAGRWAAEPGALHGWRLGPYGALLLAVSVVTLRRRTTGPSLRESALVAVAGCSLLAAAFLSTFPPSTWAQVPFYDDWPGLLQLTLNGIDTLRHGALVGWQWAFLGGYHTSADLSQSLAIPALLPVALAGPNVGFHLLLAAITAAIPLAAWYDVSSADGPVRGAFAAGLSGVVTAGYFATVMQSGMANSTAGASSVAVALAASHAARRGRRWGGPVLVLALTFALYSHAAFYGYAAICLAVESAFYRDWRGLPRLAVAFAVAFVAALPLHWELLRYPHWFVANNLYFEAPPQFDWQGLLRQIWYATEMLVLPGRWFNDYGGLTYVWLVPLAWMAWQDRSRAGFYGWATLAIVLTLRLNSPQLGLIAGRQLHLLPVVVAPALAGFIAGHAPGGWAGRALLAACIACFIAVPFAAVPHVPDVRAFHPALVDRLAAAGGHLVLLENNPHWDMIGDPDVRTERSRFDVHYEALLPAATGRLFYGQPQDGYHRSVFRGHSLAGGGHRGRAIEQVPHAEFVTELRKWGVASVFVWSDPSRRYFSSSPRYAQRWQQGAWTQFDLVDADPRAVVTATGAGELGSLSPVGGIVRLTGVPEGSPVVVRTHFHPAWTASAGGRPLAVRDAAGQLAFDAPGGDVDVELAYNQRPWLTVLALAALVGGMLWLARRQPPAAVPARRPLSRT